MTEKKSNWGRDILHISLIVAILAALFTYLLPKVLEKGKELSYHIDGPTSYISPQATGNIMVTVNGVSTPRLFAYKVRLWSTGGIFLKDVPVRFSFIPKDQGFQILSVTHDTSPKAEFGKIEESGSDETSKRYVYELLNPKDEDTVTFLTNQDADLNVFAKSEGLKVIQITPNEPTNWASIFVILASGIGVLSSFISLGLKYVSDTKNIFPFSN
jgi:hypothetical protein